MHRIGSKPQWCVAQGSESGVFPRPDVVCPSAAAVSANHHEGPTRPDVFSPFLRLRTSTGREPLIRGTGVRCSGIRVGQRDGLRSTRARRCPEPCACCGHAIVSPALDRRLRSALNKLRPERGSPFPASWACHPGCGRENSSIFCCIKPVLRNDSNRIGGLPQPRAR